MVSKIRNGDSIWWRWNDPYASDSTAFTNCTYTVPTWKFWNNTSTTTLSANMVTTWTEWNRTRSIYLPISGITIDGVELQGVRHARVMPLPELTPEAAENVRKMKEGRAAAAGKAERLLLEHLDDEQREEYRQHRRFHLTSQSGRRYCLQHGRMHNVFQVDEHGNRLVELCAHVRDQVPDADNLLAQKIHLEHNEEAFIALANRWDLRNGRVPIYR